MSNKTNTEIDEMIAEAIQQERERCAGIVEMVLYRENSVVAEEDVPLIMDVIKKELAV